MSLGKPRSAYDMTIAATAVAEGRTLLTTDATADFPGVMGLSSELVRPR